MSKNNPLTLTRNLDLILILYIVHLVKSEEKMIYSKKKVPLRSEDLKPLSLISPTDEILIFDIETTGFSRSNDTLVSITAAEFEGNMTTIHQWFADSPSEELNILNAFNALQQEKKYLITYNGHSFDIPFLYCKYQYYNIFTTLNKCKSCDLYRVARKALQLDSYKLKAIEKELGIHREDGLTGKECVQLYRDFLGTKEHKIVDLILQHNFEDVLNLIYVSKVLLLLPKALEITLLPKQFSHKSCDWYLNALQVLQDHITLEIVGLQKESSNVLAYPKELYLTNGDQLKYVVNEFNTPCIMIKIQTVTHRINDESLTFFNSDQSGLATLLQIDTDIENLLILYNSVFIDSSIDRICTAALSYLIE